MEKRQELINPSDKITIDCTDFEAACIGVCLLGCGKYGIQGAPGEDMPLFLFGGHDEWFTNTFGDLFEMRLNAMPRERIAVALESMRVEGERTSVNDICGVAQRLAKRLRASIEE